MHARCGAGEKVEITSKPYLLLSSGVPTPSEEDIEVTRRILEAGYIIGIDLIDHLIIGDHQFISLKEKGYF
ncbi:MULTISPECIES: JAB domain-containing protein [unclassified Lysinibacillus]|uniref:JAB domain-containing protein n=1 Tax=unclassified Lysinibacillus TaxID=2636778 RepID=UPI003516940C